MSANLIDFPPEEKSGGLLQDVPLLPKDFVLPPQSLQLRPDIALCGRGVDSAPISAPADPADQRRQPDPKITGDLALRATAGLHQTDRFLLKFLRKPSLLCHRVPHSSLGTLHFSEASPACFLLGLTLVVIRRLAGTKGFVLLPRRWVAERTLGWLGRWRRLAREYEELPEVSETMVKLAMIRLMLHRLAHPNRKRLPARWRGMTRRSGRAGGLGKGV